MPREITGIRDCLSRLDERFPNKEQLSKTDIFKFFGISRNTLRKYYPELWKNRFTSKSELARLMVTKPMN